MKTGITYDDVLLVPQYSDIISRREVNLTTNFGKGIELSLPIIASPMDTVSEADMAGNLGELGGLSIIHRYNTVEEQSAMIASLGKKVLVGAAVGVLDDYMNRSRAAIEAGAEDVLSHDDGSMEVVSTPEDFESLRSCKNFGKLLNSEVHQIL